MAIQKPKLQNAKCERAIAKLQRVHVYIACKPINLDNVKEIIENERAIDVVSNCMIKLYKEQYKL